MLSEDERNALEDSEREMCGADPDRARRFDSAFEQSARLWPNTVAIVVGVFLLVTGIVLAQPISTRVGLLVTPCAIGPGCASARCEASAAMRIAPNADRLGRAQGAADLLEQPERHLPGGGQHCLIWTHLEQSSPGLSRRPRSYSHRRQGPPIVHNRHYEQTDYVSRYHNRYGPERCHRFLTPAGSSPSKSKPCYGSSTTTTTPRHPAPAARTPSGTRPTAALSRNGHEHQVL